MQSKKIINNTIMLYILSFTKIILPLITLPYLTRVLTVEMYGVTTYVKSIMTYMQMIVDFGFILSATKDVVRARSDNKKVGLIAGNVLIGKLILSILALLMLIVLIITIPLLRQHLIFTLLSFVPVFLTIFLFDFLFRGLEMMQIITYRYLIMKGFATILTFILVKSDQDILWIPILDIIGTLCAVTWIFSTLQRLNICLQYGSWRQIIKTLQDSFIYFFSSVATTAYTAMNTVVVGMILAPSDVAYWGLIMQFVVAVQALYSPIADSIYPEMVQKPNLKIMQRLFLFLVPLVIGGCLITYFEAPWILRLVGGSKYIGQAYLLRWTIPLLFLSFWSIMLGWPLLGAIDKNKETTWTTILGALVQIIGVILLVILRRFTLLSLLVLRSFTELVLVMGRSFYIKKYKKKFY
ncbi:oligosaccharide flippase family protein [Bombilactobacillus thymidiniphilus]|uniref:Oligosaccharide flippase family protein n=1 Tax=Bombilactobacillus thymidiniphilus TaxID=2923363 RepID=A0ABY4PCH4_9LACO|nr:oligosaccharide flippase family protein [Bombilactobacillus thymidiniphilus]UQS83295.1 oligosaccharide flippase family protein [Bombilactobacillus thymidiniphilus]